MSGVESPGLSYSLSVAGGPTGIGPYMVFQMLDMSVVAGHNIFEVRLATARWGNLRASLRSCRGIMA